MLISWQFVYVRVLENVEIYFNARGLNFSSKKRRGGIYSQVITGKLGKTCSRKALVLGHIYYNMISDTRKFLFETLQQF